MVLPNRRDVLCDVPEMVFGSMPNDGGHLLLSDAERDALLADEPEAAPWVRPFLGAEEFINGISRWCLWLDGIAPQDLRALPLIEKRVAAVSLHRLASKRPATNRLAKTPMLFGEIRQPMQPFLAIPEVSSERRAFIPIGFLPSGTLVSNKP